MASGRASSCSPPGCITGAASTTRKGCKSSSPAESSGSRPTLRPGSASTSPPRSPTPPRLQREALGLDPAQLAATPAESFPPFRWLGTASDDRPPLLVQRLRPTATLPSRATERSSGLDLYADLGGAGESLLLSPTPTLVPTGIAIQPPPGAEAQIRPRSSFSRRGIETAFGTIDADYRGELLVALSLRGAPGRQIRIRHGERIAQLVIAPLLLPEAREVESLDSTERGAGGFGSTGR